jgi:serine phosphatase RsbU (regulator of sigma subunit)
LEAFVDQQEIASVAFTEAQLRSERLRVLGVLGFLVLLVTVAVVRIFLLRTVSPSVLSLAQFGLVSVVTVFEFWMLREIRIAQKEERGLPSWLWVLSAILETAVPAFALTFLTSDSIEPEYRPLASPAVLCFFIFITLSTLRLASWISYLTGAVAAISYLLAALQLDWRPAVPGTSAPVTQTTVPIYAITLLAGGIIAGIVADQIRRHVIAALREAETKRKLEAIQHDLDIARSIQQSLLPKESPHAQSLDIAGWNKPADETGGDYFDWLTLPDGRVVTILADVTGHGIGPALLATSCRAYARAAFGAQLDLTSTMMHLNEAIWHDHSRGRFVTFVAAVCEQDAQEVEILSAGHGPILFYSRAQDSFSEVIAQAVPFGILPTFNPDPPSRLRFCTGDMLFLSTDGFFEWENMQGEQFGIERLMNAVRTSRDRPATEIIRSLYDSVVKFSGGTSQQDDLTAVLLKHS